MQMTIHLLKNFLALIATFNTSSINVPLLFIVYPTYNILTPAIHLVLIHVPSPCINTYQLQKEYSGKSQVILTTREEAS